VKDVSNPLPALVCQMRCNQKLALDPQITLRLVPSWFSAFATAAVVRGRWVSTRSCGR
jgi:hypothetical protein